MSSQPKHDSPTLEALTARHQQLEERVAKLEAAVRSLTARVIEDEIIAVDRVEAGP